MTLLEVSMANMLIGATLLLATASCVGADRGIDEDSPVAYAVALLLCALVAGSLTCHRD